MSKSKKFSVISVLVLSLVLLTACGLKLNTEVLSSDGGVYLVSESGQKLYWKFKSDGKLDIYDSKGQLTDKGMQSSYKVADRDSSYNIIITQVMQQSDKDYSLKFTTKMVLNVPKKKQNKDEFTANVTSINVTDSQIDSNDKDIKAALEQNFSKDQLNKQFAQADFKNQKLKFTKKEANELKKIQKQNHQSATTSNSKK